MRTEGELTALGNALADTKRSEPDAGPLDRDDHSHALERLTEKLEQASISLKL